MSTYRTNLIAALSAVALCAPPALTAQTSAGSESQRAGPAATTTSATTTDEVKRATKDSEEAAVARLKGRPVRSSDGNDLGKIHDFVIDGGSGKIAQVVVSSGGVLGVGKKLRLVPASSVKQTAERFTADVPKSQFQAMWTITEDDLSAGRFPTPGVKQPAGPSSGHLVAASQLKGKSIRSDDWNVGEIEHIVVDFESSKAMALVEVDAAFAGEGGDYLVPFTKLEVRAGHTDRIASTLLRTDFSSEQATNPTSDATTSASSAASSPPSQSGQGQTSASVSSPSAGATSANSSGTAVAGSPSSAGRASSTKGQSGESEPVLSIAANRTRNSDTSTTNDSRANTASSTPAASNLAGSTASAAAAAGDTANKRDGIVTNSPPPLPSDDNERLTPTGRSSAEQTPAALTTAVMAIRHALDTDPELARENVQVTSKIVLEGSVQTDEAKSRIEELAKQASASIEIENQIRVEKR